VENSNRNVKQYLNRGPETLIIGYSKPAVVGITALGLDHTNILGTTMADIAWQKAGVMKPGSLAFTVPQPSPDAMDVLRQRAINRQVRSYI